MSFQGNIASILCGFWFYDLEKKDKVCKNPVLKNIGDSHKDDNKPVYKTTKDKWSSNKSNKNIELLHCMSGFPNQVSLKNAFWIVPYERLIRSGVIGILNVFVARPQLPIQLDCSGICIDNSTWGRVVWGCISQQAKGNVYCNDKNGKRRIFTNQNTGQNFCGGMNENKRQMWFSSSLNFQQICAFPESSWD